MVQSRVQSPGFVVSPNLQPQACWAQWAGSCIISW